MRFGAVFAALLVTAACGEERVLVQPIIDLPPATSDAYPLDAVDTLKLSVAEAGDADDLAFSTGTPDAPPRLEDIPFDDNLVLHLSGEASGVEIAYGRSCAFSVPADDLEPHLYFSRAVKWAASADPFEPTRVRGQAHAFGCGAMFFGSDDPVAQVELFDTSIGDFQLLPVDVMARTDTVLAPLPGGRALVVGGFDPAGRTVDLVEVITPGAALVEANVGPAVTEHAAAVLSDGTVVVTGGRDETQVVSEAWQFGLDNSDRLDNPEILGTMLFARAGHTMTRLSDELGAGVLIVGGRDSGDLLVPSAELYRPLQGEFQVLVTPPEAQRYGHQAIRMPGGFVLIIGGRNESGRVRSLVVYDPVSGQFVPAGDLPAGAGLTDMSVTRLPDDRVLIAGGRSETNAKVASAHIARVDPIDGRVIVVATDAMDVARAGHTAALLGDGSVLVVGGTDDASARAERYNPPSQGRR